MENKIKLLNKILKDFQNNKFNKYETEELKIDLENHDEDLSLSLTDEFNLGDKSPEMREIILTDQAIKYAEEIFILDKFNDKSYYLKSISIVLLTMFLNSIIENKNHQHYQVAKNILKKLN